MADRIVRPTSGRASMSTRLISWMLLSLSRGGAAVVAVGFRAHLRDPGVARHVEPKWLRALAQAGCRGRRRDQGRSSTTDRDVYGTHRGRFV